jgi:sulfur carrier protein ThiS
MGTTQPEQGTVFRSRPVGGHWAMQVHVKLQSRFREHLPPAARGEATIELPESATVDQLLAHLNIERRVRLVTVNDEPETDPGRVLRDGDSIRVFPFVVGG